MVKDKIKQVEKFKFEISGWKSVAYFKTGTAVSKKVFKTEDDASNHNRVILEELLSGNYIIDTKTFQKFSMRDGFSHFEIVKA